MAFASKTTRDLFSLAEALAAHEGRSLEAVSGMACGKGGFFAKLRLGRDCTTATAERLIAWFHANWPADLAWPDDIARPSAAQRKRRAA